MVSAEGAAGLTGRAGGGTGRGEDERAACTHCRRPWTRGLTSDAETEAEPQEL